MPLAVPPELKKIAPYIKRAEELDKDKSSPESRLVAYYLRQYAVQLGIPLSGSAPAAKTCLGHILGDLEKEKPVMAQFKREEASFLCRKFAVAIFDKADSEDRAGMSNKDTAKTFYAAQSFLQMLEQFKPENEENAEQSEQAAEDKKRILYSKWKATEILKAIKEGRTPTPGGFGEEDATAMMMMDEPAEDNGGGVATNDFSAATASAAATTTATTPAVETVKHDDDDFGLPMAPKATLPPQSLMPPPTTQQPNDVEDEQGTEVELGPPPAYPAAGEPTTLLPPPMVVSNARPSDRPALSFDVPAVEEQPPTPTKAKSSSMFGFMKKPGSAKNATKAQFTDAAELTKFALAAMDEKDGELAVERLQQAIAALQR
jgi:vacuolar protein sorting-associated protein VTA1